MRMTSNLIVKHLNILILRRLVLENIVVKVHSMAFDRDLGSTSFAAAIAAKPYEIYILS